MCRLVLLLLLVSGCGRPADDNVLVVYAAASLRDAFTALAADFQAAHPGVEVKFNFAGTQELRTQIEHGAAVDVFAAADAQHMEALMKAGKIADPFVFAHNEPVVVVAETSTVAIADLADLTIGRLVLGGPEVPIGRYSRAILDRAAATLGADFPARVEARVVSNELNVKQVLAKVRLGEADAGIVYRTDVGPGVRVVAIPPAVNVVAEYPVAVVQGAPHPTLARAWLDLLRGPTGRRILQGAGFGVPGPTP